MAQTEAQRRAKQKYDAKNYKTIGIKCPIEEYKVIGNAAELNNQTTSMFSRNCIKYCLENNIIFAENNNSRQLFNLRIQHNLTKTQASEELKIPYQEYVKYETGNKNPSLDVLLKACKLYDVPQSYFGINSDFIAVGNKGHTIQNSDKSETLAVSDDEFRAVKEFLEEYRKKIN